MQNLQKKSHIGFGKQHKRLINKPIFLAYNSFFIENYISRYVLLASKDKLNFLIKLKN